MTEVDIERELNNQLKKQDILPKKKDNRRLTKLRVITVADIEKVRAAKEEGQKKLKKSKGKQFSNKQSSISTSMA